MYKFLGLGAIVALLATQVHAQTSKSVKKKSSVIYLSMGTERVFYTPSTIRFVSEKGQPSFDFRLGKLKAHDEGGLEFHSDAPQYSYNVGFYSFKKKMGIEFQFDHVKYIVKQNQKSRLTGTINGEYFNRDTVITPGFIQFEHTDGANYAMLNFVKRKTLIESKNQKSSVDLIVKGGAGPVIPKTNSTIMGRRFDDAYAISGYVVGFESGLRYEFLKYLFATGAIKMAYANYKHFLIANGHGSQQWFSGQFNLMVGFQLPL